MMLKGWGMLALFGVAVGFTISAAMAEGLGTGHGIPGDPKVSQLARKDIPPAYLRLYQRAPKCRGLAWYELAAIGKAESDHGANMGPSSAGARGPMQFMPGTWRRWGRGGNVNNPAHAIPAGARFLCSVGAGRDLTRGAAAYNAGPGAVQRYGGVPPYAETRNYVAKVNAWADAYRTGRFA